MQRTYRFGRWHVQPELNLLASDRQQRKLERKAMEVLVCLLERAGEVVSVDTILRQVWAGRVVEENSVHQRISQIRKALGDNRRNPTYIGHVPRRGYHSLAEVEVVESPLVAANTATLLPPAESAVAEAADARSHGLVTSELHTRWQGALVGINHWLMVGDDRRSYLILAGLGLVPILAAPLIGIWDDRAVPVDTLLAQTCPLAEHQGMTDGFSGRWNWLIYPFVLPLWLLSSRFLFRRCFGYCAQSPLLAEPRYAPFRIRMKAAIGMWQPTVGVIVVNILLTAVDQSDVAMRFVDVSQVCPTGVMDWGWYALVYADVATIHLVWFTLWTTGEQMLLVHMAVSTAVFVFLFNLQYMRTIYLRNDPDRQQNAYVLDFDDADGRFGLRQLSTVFDWQLFVCVAGGCVLLVERYFNTRLAVVERLAHQSVCAVYDGLGLCSSASGFDFEDLSWILQDTAQVFIVVSWLLFFMTILWIANVKLLPLRVIKETGGRVAYLCEFLPANSSRALALQPSNADSVEDLAARFRSQHFWPTGDDRAADTLFFCLFIFFLMLFPVLPVDLAQIAILVLFAALSWIGTRLFFVFQQHLLARVDRSLVTA